MLQRLATLGVGGVGGVTSVSLHPFTLHAASSDTPSKPTSLEVSKTASSTSKSDQKILRACELPIYEDEVAARRTVEYELVVDEPSAYYQAISDCRKWVWTYSDSIQGVTSKVSGTYKVIRKTTKDGLQYVQKDSGALPRAVIISVAGLGGVVAGYRGGFVRKSTYATVAMAAAAAVCYPSQAADISRRGWTAVRDVTVQTYRDNVSPGRADQISERTKQDKKATPPAGTASSASPTKISQAKESVAAEQGARGDTVKKDYGMSNPEDKDMYSTRGNK